MSDQNKSGNRLQRPSAKDSKDAAQKRPDTGERTSGSAGNDSERNVGSKPKSESRTTSDAGRSDVQATPEESSQSATRRGLLRDDDIESKTGNYILSFGFPGSGKTTFQSFLIYYLTHIGPFNANPVVLPEESALGWEPMAKYNEWIKLWNKGELPPPNPTNEDDISELLLDVDPKIGRRPKLKFGILEASGELMSRIMADRSNDPKLAPTLEKYVNNPGIKMTLLLLVDPDSYDDNDLLFQNLFSFLDANVEDYRSRLSLGILVPKPAKALTLLKEAKPGYSHHSEFRGDLLDAFVEHFAPRTYKILDNWPNQSRVSVMTLHLGEMEEHAGGKRIRRADYHDIERIFEWLYRQFTGEPLEPRWWQKAFRWLQQ
jgi:hypothetical protein